MLLETERLYIKSSNTDFARAAAGYYTRNQKFLEEYEPTRNPEFYTEDYQFRLLQEELAKAERRQAYRFYLFPKSEPDTLVGIVALNEVIWGYFCSCFLGYKIDEAYSNQGYMTEAISGVTDFAFSWLNLHRIEANVMPKNKRSLRVLEKCGYEEEGFSRKYLRINGIWEDHIHMVRLNEEPENPEAEICQ